MKVGISYLRIFATIAVLCSHVASTLVLNKFEMNHDQFIFFNISMHILKFGVPVFVMITGALLLQHERVITPFVCLKKYCSRMALVLLIFGMPFSFIVLIFYDPKLQTFSFWKLICMVLNNEGLSHLWYIQLMLGIYLILPIVKIFTDNCNEKTLIYILTVLFIINSIIPFVNDIFCMSIILVPQIGIYIFYMLLGFFLSRNSVFFNTYILNSLIVFVFALIIIIGIKEWPLNLVMCYSSPLNVLLSFLLFNRFYLLNGETGRLLWKFDRVCFGVYLIHPIFIQFSFRYLHITPICNYYPAVFIIFCTFFTILSFGGAWMLSQIKPLKRYVL